MLENLAFFLATVIAAGWTLWMIPWLIPIVRRRGLLGPDMNKPGLPLVPEMGGVAVVVGFVVGLAATLSVLPWSERAWLVAGLSAILGAAFTGVVDDIFEVRQRTKALLPFLFAIPFGLVVVPELWIPGSGVIQIGILMALLAPFGITCAANATNMIDGFNGLAAGTSLVIASVLAGAMIALNRPEGLPLLAPLIGALAGLLWFNRYPARIFPGDTTTLFAGATIAVAAIVSNLEILGAVLYTPLIVEFALKARGRFQAENYSTGVVGGALEYAGRTESLTHLVMKRFRVSEPQLVAMFWVGELFLGLFVASVAIGLALA